MAKKQKPIRYATMKEAWYGDDYTILAQTQVEVRGFYDRQGRQVENIEDAVTVNIRGLARWDFTHTERAISLMLSTDYIDLGVNENEGR